MKQLKYVVTGLALLSLVSFETPAWAHGGGLDENDCHHETATGGHHCHPQDKDDTDWGGMAGRLAGLVVIGLIVQGFLGSDDAALTSPIHLEASTQDGDNDYLGLQWRITF